MMKKSLLYLLMAVFALNFISCKDDDDKFPLSYEGENLTLSINGNIWSGKKAVLENSVLTLQNVIPGESSLAINVVTESNKITGTNSNTEREVKVTGTFNDKSLNVNVELKILNTEIVGTWEVGSMSEETFTPTFDNMTPVYFVVETEQFPIVFGKTEYDSIEEFETAMNTLTLISVSELIKTVTLGEDGEVTANYLLDNKFTNSPKGMALYNLKNGKLYLTANITSLLSSPKNKSDYNPLTGVLDMLSAGVPLNMNIDSEKKHIKVYVDREFMMPLMGMVSTLMPMLPDTNVGSINPKEMVPELVEIIKGSSKFEVGMNLYKAE